MGLRSDIEDALFKYMGEPEDKGNVPQLAEGIADAVINFLTKQTFTITEMKSILEVEDRSYEISSMFKSGSQLFINLKLIPNPHLYEPPDHRRHRPLPQPAAARRRTRRRPGRRTRRHPPGGAAGHRQPGRQPLR